MLFKTQLEKELIQGNVSTNQEKGEHGGRLTSKQVESDFTFDLFIQGQWIHRPGCHSSLCYFPF